MVSYVVSLGRACVSAALIMFAAPLALGTAGFVLQSVLFSDAARFLVYRALVRIYFFCSSLSLAFSRSSLAFSLHLSARLCSRLFVQVSHRLSLSVSSHGRVCDVVLLRSPSSQASLLRIFSAISSPTIPLRDIFETAIDWHSALPALATPSFQQSRSSFTGGVQHAFHLVVRTLWYPIRSLLLSYLWVHITTLLVFFVVCALLLGFYLVYCNVPGLGPAALRTVSRVCGWLKAGATSLLARRRDLWLGRAGDDVKTAHAPVDAPWLPQDYPFALGFTFKYQLGKNLGRGTHGFVMQAQERWSGRQVAVKFVDATQSNRWPKHPQYGRCPREVLVGMLASHENIIQIIETFEDDRYFYIVQELFGDAWQPRDCVTGEPIPGATSGNSLREYIQHHGSVPLDTAHKIFKQLVSVISHLHSRGIAHCDIKPDNILIDRDANIRLIDLGSSISWLASNNDPNGPHEVLLEYFCSTIVYTAPEALKRCNGKRSCKPFLADVWALGVLLYEMVTGVQYPFRTEAMSRGGMESLTRFDELCQTKAVADVLPALRLCLEVKPSKRGTITRLAQLFPTSS